MESLSKKRDSPYEKIRAREENDDIAQILRPYATFLVNYPFIVVVVTILAVALSAVLALESSAGAKDLPNFADPSKGFEARGTDLAARFRSFENIWKEHSAGYLNNDALSALNKVSSRCKRNLEYIQLDNDYLEQFTRKDESLIFVYKHKSDQNLMQLSHMNAICKIYQDKIKTTPSYNSYLSDEPHHLPNYIAIYNNRTSCNDITDNDIRQFTNVLKHCAQYYKNNQLKECVTLSEADCRRHINDTTCTKSINVSMQYLHVLLYNTFNYLTDKSFVDNIDHLRLVTSVTPYFGDPMDMLKELHKSTLNDLSDTSVDNVQIVAYDLLTLKFEIFQSEIVLQSLLIITAIILVVLFIWIYASSLFIGVMTLLCIIFALVISYFVYGRVFDVDFFPFLNMVTLIFIVGIGADDAFVYTGIWEEAKHVYVIDNSENHTQYLVKWTIHALRHAVLAMFVTSLTTASAFYANISSSITSVKCFGLYAGTSIIVNYLLMVTLFPVVVILHDKYLARCVHVCFPGTCKTRPVIESEQENIRKSRAMNLMTRVSYYVDQFFSIYLPKVLLKLRYLWIILFLALGIGGAVVTFGKPGLKLPTSQDFQMFTSSNSLEQYARKYKSEFFFNHKGDSARPIYVNFGVESEDNGNYFNPDDFGTLKFTSEPVKIESEQLWLLNFCKSIKNESFYVKSDTCRLFELFFLQLESPCVGNDSDCCNQKIPVKPEKNFLKCLYKALNRWIFTDAILFDKNYDMRVLSLTVTTNYKATQENSYNERAYNELNKWLDGQKATLRDSSMTAGWWFAYNFNFYDLQVALFRATKQSLGIAIAVAFTVILCTTLNVLLSLFSILTIFFVISVTIGVLILSGWELNIFESVVFSVAAGLSADFTLHYSVAYRTSLTKDNRVERTKSSLEHIGAAILMGACTTFIAGLVMVPAKVLVYYQMAQFLMLVMVVSWFYSTFFFLPLCMVIGPTKNFGQLTAQLICKKVKKVKQSVRRMSTRQRPANHFPLKNLDLGNDSPFPKTNQNHVSKMENISTNIKNEEFNNSDHDTHSITNNGKSKIDDDGIAVTYEIKEN